jgi:hypothetical protein
MSNKTVIFYMFNMFNSLDNIFPRWKMVISSHQHGRRRRGGWKKMVIDQKLEVRFEKYMRLTLEISLICEASSCENDDMQSINERLNIRIL